MFYLFKLLLMRKVIYKTELNETLVTFPEGSRLMILGCPPFLSLSWKSDRMHPTLRAQGRPGRPWGNRGENPYIHLKIIGAPGMMLSFLSMLHLQSGWMFRNLRAPYTPKN